MKFLFQLLCMVIADIHYEILDKCAPPQIRQQILGIVLCLEIPLFPFTMLVTELTHKLLGLPNSSDQIDHNNLLT